jgi:hypothetical protein
MDKIKSAYEVNKLEMTKKPSELRPKKEFSNNYHENFMDLGPLYEYKESERKKILGRKWV